MNPYIGDRELEPPEETDQHHELDFDDVEPDEYPED